MALGVALGLVVGLAVSAYASERQQATNTHLLDSKDIPEGYSLLLRGGPDTFSTVPIPQPLKECVGSATDNVPNSYAGSESHQTFGDGSDEITQRVWEFDHKADSQAAFDAQRAYYRAASECGSVLLTTKSATTYDVVYESLRVPGTTTPYVASQFRVQGTPTSYVFIARSGLRITELNVGPIDRNSELAMSTRDLVRTCRLAAARLKRA